MMWDGLVESLETLEDELHLGTCSLGAKELYHLGSDLLGSEGSIDSLHHILYPLRLG